MSEGFDKAVAALAKDAAARENLKSDAEAFFKAYPSLTDDEKTTLKKLAEAIPAAVQASFKDWGALALSAITVAFFAVAVAMLIVNINTPPVFTAIPNTNPVQNQSFDPWDRVQVLFNATLPLFGALFSYWLGVTVEGRRADQAEKVADDAVSAADSEKKKTEALLAASNPAIVDEAKRRYPGLFPQQ